MWKSVRVLVAILELNVPLAALALPEPAWIPHPVLVQHLHGTANARNAFLAPP